MASELREFSPNDAEMNEEMADLLFPKSRLCFCIPSTWRRMRRDRNDDDTWWERGIGALKKVREWSEIVAGPRWKTFIRRFNRSKSGGGGAKSAKFQYDPMSYALNFDDGERDGNSEEEFGFRNFSVRYAAVPAAAAAKSEVVAFT